MIEPTVTFALVSGTLTYDGEPIAFPRLNRGPDQNDLPAFAAEVGDAEVYHTGTIWKAVIGDAEWESTSEEETPWDVEPGAYHSETNPDAWEPQGDTAGTPVFSSGTADIPANPLAAAGGSAATPTSPLASPEITGTRAYGSVRVADTEGYSSGRMVPTGNLIEDATEVSADLVIWSTDGNETPPATGTWGEMVIQTDLDGIPELWKYREYVDEELGFHGSSSDMTDWPEDASWLSTEATVTRDATDTADTPQSPL
jgi:hypothetical protein